MLSEILLSWMAIAMKRNNYELRKELCCARDILDGILDEWPEYACKHLPMVMTELDKMKQSDDVIAIRQALIEKARSMGWKTECSG
jgi:hypothetical protein